MEYFKKELNLIQDEEVREQTRKVLERVNDEFFHAAASSTGKYHPSYALGDGGLYRHTQAAVGIAKCLMDLDMFDYFTPVEKDYIIAALILHDSCKSGIEWDSKYTKHEHPVLAQQLIDETLGNCEFTVVVGALVASHMGQWNRNFRSRTVLPVPETDAAKLVHVADYLASRKFLEYVFENEEENEV